MNDYAEVIQRLRSMLQNPATDTQLLLPTAQLLCLALKDEHASVITHAPPKAKRGPRAKTVEAVSAPQAPKPGTKRTRKATAAEPSALGKAVVTALEDGPLRAETLRLSLGCEAPALKAALKQLMAGELLAMKGKARGATYQLRQAPAGRKTATVKDSSANGAATTEA